MLSQSLLSCACVLMLFFCVRGVCSPGFCSLCVCVIRRIFLQCMRTKHTVTHNGVGFNVAAPLFTICIRLGN